jgi:hypothetical protein
LKIAFRKEKIDSGKSEKKEKKKYIILFALNFKVEL